MKIPADLVPGKSPLPGLQMAAYLLCLHMMEKERWKEQAL